MPISAQSYLTASLARRRISGIWSWWFLINVGGVRGDGCAHKRIRKGQSVERTATSGIYV